MTPTWTDGDVSVHLGGALPVLRAMADESVDALVTDPCATDDNVGTVGAMSTDLVTVKQAAGLMQCSRSWVERLIERGALVVAERRDVEGQPRPLRFLRRRDVESWVARRVSRGE